MDEREVLEFLKAQKKPVLLDYLEAAFRSMTGRQRRDVFGDAVLKPKTKKAVDADKLLKEITLFHRDSKQGRYYAPFNVNSKNYMEVPEETDEWCDAFADLVKRTMEVTAKGDHSRAVAGFAMLYELVQAVDNGDEIIFAEEAGSWMIPADEKAWLRAYLTSLAATTMPEAFATAVMPMLRRDSLQSFSAKVYISALKVANPQQKVVLQAEIKRKNIRTN